MDFWKPLDSSFLLIEFILSSVTYSLQSPVMLTSESLGDKGPFPVTDSSIIAGHLRGRLWVTLIN